jgi:cell division septal protein FtsQ
LTRPALKTTTGTSPSSRALRSASAERSLSSNRSPRNPRKNRSPRNKYASAEGRALGGLRSRHCFLVLLFALAQMLVFSSQMFQVDGISVAGTETISQASILKMCGLKKGDYLWRQSPTTVANRLRALQNLESAQVSFVLPGQVHITINERQPVYQVASNAPHSPWFGVDAHGLVLRQLKGASNELPRLKVEESLKVGHRLHPALIASVTQACQQIEKEFPNSIWYYTLDQRGNLSFRTFSQQYPVDVQLGNPEQLEQKMHILRALMTSVLKKEKVVAVDLRFPTPVVRLLHPPKPPTPETT